MHSAHATISGLADERKCESVSSAEICQQKRKLRSDKISNNFFYIPSRKSLELEQTGKSDSDSEPEVFFHFHEARYQTKSENNFLDSFRIVR